jgi:hypothetical protein
VQALALIGTETSSNQVALAAIVVSGVVGVAAPIAAGVFSWKRTTRELDGHDRRQERAHAAEGHRLERQLRAEADRFKMSLIADEARARNAAKRETLDQACVLLMRFRGVVAKENVLSARERWETVVEEVAAQRARLLLWFAADSELVGAYQEALFGCTRYAEAQNKSGEAGKDARRSAMESLNQACDRYFAAVREHVAGPT